MTMQRSSLLLSHLKELRKLPCFQGSLADQYVSTHLKDDAIITALKDKRESLERLINFFKTQQNRCGEPTKGEKALYNKLIALGY